MVEIKRKNSVLITDFSFRIKIEDIIDSYENKLKNNLNVKKSIKKIKKKLYKNSLENIVYIIIIKFIIILNLLQITILSNITLRIQGRDNIKLFGDDFKSYPKEIYINGNKQSDIYNSYYFNETNNFVDLI